MGRCGAGVEQDWIGPRGHLRQWRVLLVVLRTVVEERCLSPSPWQPMVTCQPSPYHSRGGWWGEHRVMVNAK